VPNHSNDVIAVLVYVTVTAYALKHNALHKLSAQATDSAQARRPPSYRRSRPTCPLQSATSGLKRYTDRALVVH